MRYDFCIVGAGPAGLVLAERIANINNQKVLVVEKRNHIGGNLHDQYDNDGVLIHTYGPHFFRTNEKYVWEYLENFTEWHNYEHKVKASINGMEVPFPINLDTYNSLHNKNLSSDEFAEWLDSNKFTDNPKNAEEAIINQVGEYLYETFFKNYTIKQWGKHPRELHPDTVKRVPVRIDRENRYQTAKYQGLPKNGYTQMFKKMLKSKNIHVLLNADYKDILDSIHFDHLIYTGPIDYFYNFKHGKLEYRSLKFVRKFFKKESFQSSAVINYPNNYDYTRITEYKKMTGQEHFGTSIHEEYPMAYIQGENDPYYPVLDERNLLLRDLYTDESKKESNVTFIGRLAEYRYYAMDEVIEKALLTFSEKFQKTKN
ncbi:UDP-galactopyranose mutase [Psychrobacter sp. FDAARGOS_221]|uniref:UDP-galactopyranose mutase n=1 Tax=Psychrobacter sp. FDAARGOS_221 TaxID=1975705 RepID=UPI000BB53DE2|nr:UDP-galactopyranose mutase [Psychrobacter sp. FDAARGOS_221]PNK61167.1 UDP-galactopyranose mutase [Psychrobacter sp. FDAARGOS_221]